MVGDIQVHTKLVEPWCFVLSLALTVTDKMIEATFGELSEDCRYDFRGREAVARTLRSRLNEFC